MEWIMNGLCVVACLLLPMCWGCAWGYGQSRILQQHTEKKTDHWLFEGWIVFFSGFAVVAAAALKLDFPWDRMTAVFSLYMGLLTIGFLVLLLSGDFRAYAKQQIVCAFLPENCKVWGAFAAGVVLIGFLYLRQGFTLEVYHTLPEEVVQVAGLGAVKQSTKLPLFYALLSVLFSRRPEVILFQIMPFALLFVYFDAALQAADLFLDEAADRCFFLLVFTLTLLCGSGAHMNVPYTVLHAPYEGDALMGIMAVFWLLGSVLLLSEKKAVLLLAAVRICLGFLCAWLFAGRLQGLLTGAMEIVVLGITMLLLKAWRLRRK